MSVKTHQLDDALHAWLLRTTVREPALLAELRAETAALPEARMQISAEQGRFMQLLVELLGVRRAIEVGVFTGYSALCVACAMPDDGRLIACDVSRRWTDIGRRYWKRAGVEHKIDLRLGPADGTLDGLIADGGAGTFDMMFIDADKSNYGRYYEAGLRLLRCGGLMAIDNALWSGKVADPTVTDADTAAIRSVVEQACGDGRVSASLVPIGDGLLLARKR
ncbi:putative O-methyltransferase [Phycisphaerae bacterium RAS1]|nr:putative O-methyltransferase [Phycisphaerae bacterium RAS1]